MSLPRDVYWTKEDGEGRLTLDKDLVDADVNLLFTTKREAKAFCFDDERPVKVRITKEG